MKSKQTAVNGPTGTALYWNSFIIIIIIIIVIIIIIRPTTDTLYFILT